MFMLPRPSWRLARLIYTVLLNKAGIRAVKTPCDPLFARPPASLDTLPHARISGGGTELDKCARSNGRDFNVGGCSKIRRCHFWCTTFHLQQRHL